MITQKLDELISKNTEVFKRELKETIKPSFDGLDNPEKYIQILKNIISQSDRDLLLRQSRLVAAATEYIENRRNKSLIISAEMGSGKCILPDSNVVVNGQVYTIEEAYKKFADLNSVLIDKETPNAYWYKTNQKLTVPSYKKTIGKIVNKKIDYFYRQEVSEVIREVKTIGGYSLKTTKVHKFLTPNGWTNSISAGDYIAVPKRESIFGKQQNIIDASLLAWLIGEGYFESGYTRLDGEKSSFSINFTQKDKDVFDKIYDLALSDGKISVSKKNVDTRNGINRMRLYKVSHLVREGLRWGVSKDKKIPEFLMQSTKDDIEKFIVAYFDAEGSVNVDRKSVEISTASETLAYQLMSLFRKLSIATTLGKMKKSAANGKNIKKNYFRIMIGGSSLRQFVKLAKKYSIVDYKIEKLKSISMIRCNNNIETVCMHDLICQLREQTGLSRAKSYNLFSSVYLNGSQRSMNIYSVKKFINLVDDIMQNKIQTPKQYDSNILEQIKKEAVERLSQDLYYVKVVEVKEYLYRGYVYDLSISDTHNFIANNMIVHNTTMAVQISMSQKLCPVYFIACPPHLVKTWQEELEINYKNKKAYKAIVVKRFEDLVPYTKRDLWNDGIKYYFIVARETLKLSYPKIPAVITKRKYITTEKELDGQSLLIKQLIKVAKCPDCNATLKEGTENHIDTSVIPLKCECGCVLRQPDRSVSQNMGTREAIADYVFKNFTKGSYNVILDEAHEYKGGNTGQGNAMARLVSGAKKSIALTGTLMNGYASSLFYLLYRLNPNLMKVKLGYDYNQVQQFVSTYGAHEEIVEAKEVTYEGVVTRMGKRINVKEKPKISPHLLSVLLDMTIFLRLDEIKMPSNLQLPDYTEIIDLVPMEEELRLPYISYLEKITSQLRKDKRLLGNLATDAIAIPDMPFMFRSAQDKVFYEPKFTREEFGVTAKEKKLVENIRKELDDGRNCMVYLTFTNQIVATDITKILQDEFPSKVIKFLPSSVAPTKRKEWIEKNPCDVLIANPELVKTGLTLLQFPTIIFYETTYNVFTLKQASRRSWRIGQRYPVKVIFMAYANTPQHKALELIGAKVAAANSLEGRLSGDDDLSAMGEDEDNIQLALAKAILNNESSSKDIKTTTITNFGNDRDFDAFEMFYQTQLDNRNLGKELIEATVQNEKDGLSIHDGHGGNWGHALADLFDISNNPNIHICSMPKEKENEATKEVLVFDSLLSYDGEITSNTFYYYSGKGKNQKKIEVQASNIADYIPEDALKNGIQLSLF